MEELAIRVEHVSKEYRLGAIGGATLKGEIQSKLARLRHKEDPNLKIGEKTHEKNERFLALNDMSFDIKKGETVGIIGRNGAGKSTILKLICRVTAPTKGNIYLNGRITSMLEVGTGFHPELTGRENVYLNGAILGMNKAEIDRKFDEIVEFSEVGQFIDTPVKRYSSGMKVKLAFAVASHLDSEIMIMDEVLAVGDVSFQNKCIDRMKKVAEEEGRTILYVSHNMSTVKSLCNRCIVLSHGQVAFEGNTEEAIAVYMQDKNLDNTTFFDTSGAKRHPKCNQRHLLQNLHMYKSESCILEYGDVFPFRIEWKSENDTERLLMKMVINGIDTTPVGGVEIELTASEAEIVGNGASEGLCTLNGEQALTYARIRKIDSDFQRTARQRKIMGAVFEKAKTYTLPGLAVFFSEILPLMATDMTEDEMMTLALTFASSFQNVEIKSYTVPAEGTYKNAAIRGMAVLVPDLYEIKKLIFEEYLPM